MKNVKQEFTTHKIAWSKRYLDGYVYCLTDSVLQGNCGYLMFFDKEYFDDGIDVMLINILVPSNKTVSGWLIVYSYLNSVDNFE